MKPKGMTVGETTRRLGGYEAHTYALLRAGRLTGRKVNGRWQIDEESVMAHLRRRQEREGIREATEKISA